MVLRACLTCGEPSPGSRCDACRRAVDRTTAQHRGTTTARGYGHRWQQRSNAVRRTSPVCEACGTTGNRSNPLTVDHITPKAAGGTDHRDNLRTLCRRCNSAKGAR
jgi:5-methylcytosine-specific restriction protein A